MTAIPKEYYVVNHVLRTPVLETVSVHFSRSVYKMLFFAQVLTTREVPHLLQPSSRIAIRWLHLRYGQIREGTAFSGKVLIWDLLWIILLGACSIVRQLRPVRQEITHPYVAPRVYTKDTKEYILD